MAVDVEVSVFNTSLSNASAYDNFSMYGDFYNMYDFYRVPQIVLVSLLCVSIIVGNSCVLAAIRLSETGRKSRMNFFIMHLAIADLLVGVMVSLTDLAQKITIDWYAGNVLCKLIYFTQAVVTYSSTYMLVSLSIDRYDAVARPMNFSRSAQKGRALVIVGWVVSTLFALPTPFIYQQHTIEGRHQCWLEFPEYWHWNLYFTVIAVVTFFIPAVIIAGCYIAIIYIIWSKSRTHQGGCISCCFSCTKSSPIPVCGNNSSSGGGTNVDTNNGSSNNSSSNNGAQMFSRSRSTWSASPSHLTINNSRHDTGRGIIPQAKIRTIKMTLIIVIVFILCWSPFFIYNLLELYHVIPHNNPVTTLIQSVAPLNSAANPIIYGIFSTRICRNLRRIPCLRRSVCPCTGRQHERLNNYHAHHNNHHHHYYPSYNNKPYTSSMAASKSLFRSRQTPTSQTTENTAMTFDLQKVRLNSSRSDSVSGYTKSPGTQSQQSFPMMPLSKAFEDATVSCSSSPGSERAGSRSENNSPNGSLREGMSSSGPASHTRHVISALSVSSKSSARENGVKARPLHPPVSAKKQVTLLQKLDNGKDLIQLC